MSSPQHVTVDSSDKAAPSQGRAEWDFVQRKALDELQSHRISVSDSEFSRATTTNPGSRSSIEGFPTVSSAKQLPRNTSPFQGHFSPSDQGQSEQDGSSASNLPPRSRAVDLATEPSLKHGLAESKQCKVLTRMCCLRRTHVLAYNY